ncbi:MAG: DNA repair protein RecO [Actinomycetaceae bacterium]|nr:DNA repair protein RecO [Actinomycetaceae bacterium]
MKLYRDEAIVLRTHDLGEADRIITLLTRHHGKIRCVAKGVRRTKSRFGARLEPFAMIDVQLYEGRTLDVVTEAITITPYSRAIAGSYEAYTAASALAEVADNLAVDEGEPDPRQYLLLLGALHALATRAHRPSLVVDSYILRAMALSGWGLALASCATCGREDDLTAFNVRSGGVVCTTCAPRGSAHPAAATIELLGALVSGRWQDADGAAEHCRRECSALVAAFSQWQLERQVHSLRMMEMAR